MTTTSFIIIILVCIVLYFILRELFCWYWKINKRIELMEEQNHLLRIIAGMERQLTENGKKHREKNDDAPREINEPEFAIPEVSIKKGDNVKFSDGTKTTVVNGIDGYFFVSDKGRHYYKTEASAIRASYIYKTTKVVSKKNIIEP